MMLKKIRIESNDPRVKFRHQIKVGSYLSLVFILFVIFAANGAINDNGYKEVHETSMNRGAK